ncbi:COX assembly mitochondrial protein homolog isoform X3 [Hemicordylus capensis]|uniref:COX assembly mitochondrial protein homolog isoform X3 n=1 Tax=Hemicordylus capensis TaxID=884348 RepID=UPI0023026486|nr:COX assembly mitochondrial protein homolog isoform X3 [Hemicordylus capensis]
MAQKSTLWSPAELEDNYCDWWELCSRLAAGVQLLPVASATALVSSGLLTTAAATEEADLRHVEKDVLIPKMMREKARELCSDKVQAFTKCCQDAGILMVVKCQEENTALKKCLTAYYTDPAFFEECKTEYLKQREEYRATGIRPGQKQQRLPTSM